MKQRSHVKAERLFRYSLVVSIALSGVVLGLYAYLGTYARMIADDFCFAFQGLEKGPIGGVIYGYTTFSGRYTDFFIEYSIAPAKPLLNIILPALTVIAFTISVIYILFQLFKYINLSIRPIFIYSAALFLTFIFYRLMPSYQHAFWLAAIIAYTWVVILIIFYMGTLFQFLQTKCSRYSLILYLMWTVVFMLFVGGLHELSITILIGVFGFLFLISLLFESEKRKEQLSIFITALFSLATSLVIALLAPGVANRRVNIAENMDSETTLTLWEALPNALVYTLAYIFGEPIGITFGQTYAIAFLVTLFIVIVGWGLLYASDQELNLQGEAIAGRLFWMTGLVGVGAIFAVIFPSIYAANGVLPMRVVIFTRFVQIVMFIVWGYVTLLYAQKYDVLARVRKTTTWSPLLLVIAFLLVWTPAVSLYTLATLFPDYQTYAQAWDERHQALLDAPDNTTVTIDALAYNIEESLVLEVPEDDPTFWINGCMANFYDLEGLIVTPQSETE